MKLYGESVFLFPDFLFLFLFFSFLPCFYGGERGRGGVADLLRKEDLDKSFRKGIRKEIRKEIRNSLKGVYALCTGELSIV